VTTRCPGRVDGLYLEESITFVVRDKWAAGSLVYPS
jgi:hypothetical protein